MGLDFIVVFKEPILYNGESNNQFTPFSRALSNFLYANYYGEDFTLQQLDQQIKGGAQFLIGPNLHEYQVDEMQIEFADGEKLQALLEEQKELLGKSQEAWRNISKYLDNLNILIDQLVDSDKASKLSILDAEWGAYIKLGELAKDLLGLKELLESAKEENQIEFTFDIN